MDATGKIKKITAPAILHMKGTSLITCLTAYDYSTARIVDDAGIDIILVGDSLGGVMLGYENTIPVKMDEMLHHTLAVSRGVKRALVIGDMPFMSYQAGDEEAVRNAGRFIKEAGAHAIKIEGGAEMAPRARAIVNAGIPVMGHIGLTPQSIHRFGGHKVQGRDEARAEQLLADAKALEKAGCFSIVLECIPPALAKKITESISIPTIGIGAGIGCDGQVLVIHDMLGLTPGNFRPKFVKQYAQLGEQTRTAIKQFADEVRNRKFPTKEFCYD
ncbi:3-methyl-2-oxobutanoate hydroxymethyltransferase [Candidatus Micrarchaeota archaeon]|nr:3-methyl-2-oxobutanoate hydroxymethyltransferase [Candidatus Micrarchaeota archaeon]